MTNYQVCVVFCHRSYYSNAEKTSLNIVYFCNEITTPIPVCSVVVHLPPTVLSDMRPGELLSLTLNIKSSDFLPPPAIKETPLYCGGQYMAFFFSSVPLPPPISQKQMDFSKRKCLKRPRKYREKS